MPVAARRGDNALSVNVPVPPCPRASLSRRSAVVLGTIREEE